MIAWHKRCCVDSSLFEPLFHEQSYGFRPGRSCHDAMRQVDQLHKEGHRFVLDADISGFFDQIPHHVIMRGPRNVVADGNILDLVVFDGDQAVSTARQLDTPTSSRYEAEADLAVGQLQTAEQAFGSNGFDKHE